MACLQVRIVISKTSGTEYACKSIQKRLDIANVSPQRQAAHLENIYREIKVLKRLRGALDVVNFKGAYEDDAFIHIVMEYCRGGELLHHISSTPHYTERTVTALGRLRRF
jgi:calcium-dependent protein kinase